MRVAPQTLRDAPLSEQIAQVEHRLALRRQRTVRHLAEARADLAHARRWLPLVGLTGALAVGMVIGRRPDRDVRDIGVNGGTPYVGARTGRLAFVAGLAGTALRIALSPPARALWTAYRNRHPHGPTR